MLRASLVKQFRSQKLEENKNEKAVRVYDFFKSDIFANQMRKLVDFHKLRVEQLDNEERYLTVQIKKRRHHLAYEVNFVMGFLGVLEAEGGADDFKLLNEQLGLIIPDFDDSLAKELQ